MARRHRTLPLLQGDQALAADPAAHASLSASAGTGKTQVLTARVFRLLLQGVEPGAILCLTYTKSGAAEMANRISSRLASWVRLSDEELEGDLKALGERGDPPSLQRARRLFARLLETPGGLRIQTIHAFAQTLLAAFPAEAGIVPGFAPIEGRAEEVLARRTLADLLDRAERNGDVRLLDDVATLSLRLGKEEAVGYLMRCAGAAEAIAAIGDGEAIEAALREAVSLPGGDIAAILAERCADGQLDCGSLRLLAEANRSWGTSTGLGHVDTIERFLDADPGDRAAMLDLIAAVVLTGKGTVRTPTTKLLVHCPDYSALAEALAAEFNAMRTMRNTAELVAIQAAGLRAGAAFARAYAAAKRAAGVADFNDLIVWTRAMLVQPGMGEWVRYKLDRRTDHILVDEAQDTNAEQWQIVDALAGEFFAGMSSDEARHRTLFMVGDFKQAIYGFQGTDPQEFDRMRDLVRERVESLSGEGPEFRDLSIDASYRSAPAILETVDALIREVGFDAMGLARRPNPHRATRASWPGRVELWPVFEANADDAGDEEEVEGEEGWLSDSDRRYAERLADEVRRLLDRPPLLSSTGRPLTPGDILILVRSRRDLAGLLVARLFAAGVPVAGVDRLLLKQPFAVRDLVAAIRFAVQPLDDLNLAELLVSPLFGWSQNQLYALAQPRPDRQPLWRALRDASPSEPLSADTLAALQSLLAITDYVTPAHFLETILSGALDGRRKLLHRLGAAARDPIDELLASALDFERTEIASLDRFLAWFESGKIEVKRDNAAGGNAVRVMTVHAAKGLEAPLVILADATVDPAQVGGRRGFDLPTPAGPVPLVRPRQSELAEPFGSIAAESKLKELQEHWRLLYVGMTRAAEMLVVAGVRKKRAIVEDCWHVRVERALTGLGAEPGDDGRLVWTGDVTGRPAAAKATKPTMPPPPLPDWLARPAPPEPRPTRPLTPSTLGEDRDSSPPPSPAQVAAARRGTMLHALFERLPAVATADRRATALNWLQRTGGIVEAEARVEMVDAVLAVLDDPRFADLFAPTALAEAPIAAALSDGRVIAGTVDRLCVSPDTVRVVDFKTGRAAPATAAEVPPAHAAQMRAYAEALEVIFPGRRIETALLYTAAPRLIELTG